MTDGRAQGRLGRIVGLHIGDVLRKYSISDRLTRKCAICAEKALATQGTALRLTRSS